MKFYIDCIHIRQEKDLFNRPLDKWQWLIAGRWVESKIDDGKFVEYSSITQSNVITFNDPYSAISDLKDFLKKLLEGGERR